MDTIIQDVKFGLRVLRKNPGFTAVAVLVLALGIGANTAIFTLINAFLLRPLPVEKPHELYQCFHKNAKRPNSYRAFSYPNYVDLRENNSTFSRLAAFTLAMVGLTEGETTKRVFADIVTANFFETFGVKPRIGRAFSPAEETPGNAIPVAIVSHSFWRKKGSDPGLLGKPLLINGRFYSIVGVSPEEFTGTMAILSPEIYLPLGMYEAVINDLFTHSRQQLAERNNHCLILVGRLKPGMIPARAEAELGVAAAQLEKAFPAENQDYSMIITRPLSRLGINTNPQDGSELKTASVLLMSMSCVVLLIACLNLANMLMARTTARRKEFAIRLALGGSRIRILQQLLIEGLMLSILGGAAGLVFTYWGTSLLVSSMSNLIPFDIVFHSGPDLRVLSALMSFCVLSTLVSGLGPALKASRPTVISDLKENAGEDTDGKGWRWFARQNVLVVAQVSLSLVLLTTAGLFIRSAMRAADADPGFSMDNGLILEVDPSLAGYDEVRSRETYRTLLERLRSIPGIQSASLAATVPFGMVSLGEGVYPAGAGPVDGSTDPQASGKSVSASSNIVGADYFSTIGLSILRGRSFNKNEAETGSAGRVAIIDVVLAKKLWPGEEALGKRIEFRKREGQKDRQEIEIIGIVRPVRERLFERTPEPHVYLPFGQRFQSNMNVHLKISARGKEAEVALIQSIRRETRALDERLPILALKTLRGHLESSLEIWIVRTGARMFAIFGALALFLAVVGLYGVKAYTVARRTREIGIRMALGATSRHTLWQVLRDGLVLSGVGLFIGLLLAIAVARLLASMLYEVSAADPLILIATPLVLATISAIACYLPARRAAKINPIVALRYE